MESRPGGGTRTRNPHTSPYNTRSSNKPISNSNVNDSSASTTSSTGSSRKRRSAPDYVERHKSPPVSIKIRLKRFHAVAAWSWNANDDVCGICQAAFEGVCPGVKYPGEDCPVVWGKCGHAFHLQCVSKWLGTPAAKNTCPICRQDWEFGQNPVSNSNDITAGVPRGP